MIRICFQLSWAQKVLSRFCRWLFMESCTAFQFVSDLDSIFRSRIPDSYGAKSCCCMSLYLGLVRNFENCESMPNFIIRHLLASFLSCSSFSCFACVRSSQHGVDQNATQPLGGCCALITLHFANQCQPSSVQGVVYRYLGGWPIHIHIDSSPLDILLFSFWQHTHMYPVLGIVRFDLALAKQQRGLNPYHLVVGCLRTEMKCICHSGSFCFQLDLEAA